MGKIYNTLTDEIKTAMKSGQKNKVLALRNLKKRFQDYITSEFNIEIMKQNNGEIPDSTEIDIIKKYVKELQKDIETYSNINTDSARAAIESTEIEKSFIEVYLPKEATAEDVEKTYNAWWEGLYPDVDVRDYQIEQRQIRDAIAYIKSVFDNVNGGLVAEIVKKHIKK